MSNEVTIDPNPAQQVVVDTEFTFADFAKKVAKKKFPLRHGSETPGEIGAAIELEPGSKNCVLILKLSKYATKQQFFEFYGIIEQGIVEAVTTGVIEPDWFQGLRTTFDLTVPEVPEQFQDEDHEIKAYWVGEHGYVFTQTPIPVESEEEEEEGEPLHPTH